VTVKIRLAISTSPLRSPPSFRATDNVMGTEPFPVRLETIVIHDARLDEVQAQPVKVLSPKDNSPPSASMRLDGGFNSNTHGAGP
jgi:hypothetical protein